MAAVGVNHPAPLSVDLKTPAVDVAWKGSWQISQSWAGFFSNFLVVQLAPKPPQTVMLIEETSGTMWMKGMDDIPLVQKRILFSAWFSNMILDHSDYSI